MDLYFKTQIPDLQKNVKSFPFLLGAGGLKICSQARRQRNGEEGDP